ncbi:MAG: hypothetical protein K0U47_02845 [Epsilonproteobacteria bacterium]|nr:hypothetical protein [Campylobacterota bacterium]
MKVLLLLLLFSTLSIASKLGLLEIEKHQVSHPFYLMIEEKKTTLKAKLQQSYASIPLTLSLNTAHAKPKESDAELEYSVGVTKSFYIGDQKTKGLQIDTLELEASLLALEQQQIAFSNQIKADYHQSCLNLQQRTLFEKSYHEFEKLYTTKKKAYHYQEISKKELLQLSIEKQTLVQTLQQLKDEEHLSKEALFSTLQMNTKNDLACSDLYQNSYFFEDNRSLFQLSKTAIRKKIAASKKRALLYERNFETVNLSIGYDKEIDMERYGVGLALPLAFTSKKNSYQKIVSLHQQKALKLEQQNMLLEKNIKFKKLQIKLNNDAMMISTIKKNLQKYKDELLPLLHKSYMIGESSVLDYLINKQKFWQLQHTLNIHQKNYYQTLFTLFTVAEIKDIK